MVRSTIDELELRRYLLGTLTEEEEARQEERLLTEENYFERLILAEDDLIDDYVRGKLSAEHKERMEQRFFSSARRQERLQLARDLSKYTSARAAVPGRERDSDRHSQAGDAAIPPIGIPLIAGHRKRIALLASAALLVIAVGAGLILEIARLNSKIDGQRQEQITAQQREEDLHRELAGILERQEQLSRELEREQNRSIELEQFLADLRRSSPPIQRMPDADLLSLDLTAGRIRDTGHASVIEIPASTKWVRLRLSLERSGYVSYRARVQTDEGKPIWTANDLRMQRIINDEMVAVVLPAALLVPGDYTILLTPTAGRERIGTYYFTALRKKQ